MTSKNRASKEDVTNWVVTAARAADAKNGADTLILEVGAVLAITDYFVITSASNTRLVKSLTDEVEDAVRKAGGPSPLRREGLDDLRWVLLDYGDFVLHVFLDEARSFYELERLWRDVPRVEWRDAEEPVRS